MTPAIPTSPRERLLDLMASYDALIGKTIGVKGEMRSLVPILEEMIPQIEAEAKEQWRSMYFQVAEQYAIFLERFDLAEDVGANEIIDAIEAAAVATERARLRAVLSPERGLGFVNVSGHRIIAVSTVLALLDEQP